MGQPFHQGEYPANWKEIAAAVKDDAGGKCVRCGHDHCVPSGHVLTVHHFDGNKANCARWNLMALCQRCHLSVQARVDPSIPIMFDPSPWSMPYIAGLYEAGKCVAPASYSIARWKAIYEEKIGKWPAWAVQEEVSAGG